MRSEPEGIEKLRRLKENHKKETKINYEPVKAPKIKKPVKFRRNKISSEMWMDTTNRDAEDSIDRNIMDLLDMKPVNEITYADLKEVYRPVARKYGGKAIELDKMKSFLRQMAIAQAMDEVNGQLEVMFLWIDEISAYRKMKG